MIVGVSMVASAITSVIVTKVLVAHYFKIVDGYVKDMCNLTKKSSKYTLDAISKLEQSFHQKE